MKTKDSKNTFMKIVVGVFCVMVVLYLAFSMLKNAGSSYTTYKAVRFEVGDGITTSGFVVRDEEVLTSSQSIIVLTRAEGARVSAGGVVANSYSDEAARRRQAQIDAKQDELAQMQYAYSYSGSDTSSAALDNEIVRDIQLVNTLLARQDLSAAQSTGEQLKSLVLRRYITSADAETLHQRILKTEAELDALMAQSQYAASEITVEHAGYFSGTADGYERLLTPEFVETADVAQLTAMQNRQPSAPANAIGKLVSDARWYYICVADTDSLQNCKVGSYVTVQFSYGFYNDLQMRVSRIGSDENGKTVLVLTTDRYLQTAISYRAQSAEIIFENRTGLRVPKNAIYVNDEGISGVYVLSGARAAWKPVELLIDCGDYFLVREDRSSTNNLWPEDEIILTTEEIYHGKVMNE